MNKIRLGIRRSPFASRGHFLYQVMILQHSIGEHLLKVDKAAREREEMILKQLKEKDLVRSSPEIISLSMEKSCCRSQ